MDSMEDTILHARKMAEHYETKVASLIAEHGTGTRPSWVSTDLNTAMHRAKSYRDMADALLEADNDWTECQS